MHASIPPKRTSRRLRRYPPESQERVEVGSADEEASPPPGSARVDYAIVIVCSIVTSTITGDVVLSKNMGGSPPSPPASHASVSTDNCTN